MHHHASACVHSSPAQQLNRPPIPGKKPVLRRRTALALALLLAPVTASALFAQEQQSYPPPPPDYSYNSPQNYAYKQSAPAQQYPQPSSSYSQPNYGQPGYGPSGYAQQPEYNQPQASSSNQQALDSGQRGLDPEQLEQLVAPIALYPDPLVALVLAASTYPQQVQQADQWRQSQSYAAPDQIVYGADQQNWDPSVKALTAFPQVLAEMDQNIQWTYALGNAYYNQPQDILQAIQIMRQRAAAAGNLESTPQESVSYDQGDIQLMPANPQIVYVPSYNPWTSYGDPVTPYPGFSLLGAIGSFFNSSLGSSAIQYGLGIVLSAFNHTPWGLFSWGLDWLGEHLLFNHSDYYSSSTYVSDWGLPYGGPRARFAPRGYSGYGWVHNGGWYGHGRYNNWNGGYRNAYNHGYRNRYAWNRSGGRYGYRDGVYSRVQSPFAHRWNNNGYGRSFDGSHRIPGNGSYLRFASNSGYRYRSQSPFARGTGGESFFGGRSYRVPSMNDSRRSFAPRYSFSHGGFSDSYKPRRSGGFHLFGSGHNSGFGHSSGFSRGSFKMPHYKAPHYKAPKFHASHGFGVGHHSFGGGGHHSFGGHHR